MIVDVHGHTVAPAEVYEYQSKMIARRGPMARPAISDEALAAKLDGHVRLLDEVGTDVQFISPRPYTLMHSLFNTRLVGRWTRFVNDIIHRQVGLRPDRFRGVAGLPQFRTTDLTPAIEELTRCVEELGFVGCLLNPDPMEGEAPPPPGLGDEYWHPLYERLCELDVPALIHSASCGSERESYSLHFINEETIAVVGLLNSKVFTHFPTLKIVVGHGGGAVPYQLGRFRAPAFRRGGEDFAEALRRLHFDTCVYSREGLELLFKVVGPANCLYGTERPGTGSPVDPSTGRTLDDLRPIIEGIETLSDADRQRIFAGNAHALYARAFSEQTEQRIAAKA
ncbi:MAG: amidohydrolase [Actinomycetota bacterium]|nr:amidohydrolase [Actinomycetota bacterium]